MRSFAATIWDRLRRAPQTSKSRAARPRSRPTLEFLEDRTAPAADATGTVSGMAFIDLNANGAFDSNEIAAQGVPVTLLGSPAPGVGVNVTATTDANGKFTFLNVPPGTYAIGSGATAGLLGVVTGATTIVVPGGGTVLQDFGYLGLAPESISMLLFLSSTSNSDFPRSPAGSGEALAGERANTAPIVARPIADIVVGRDSPNTVIDLAGHFDDADFTNSLVRLNTSLGPVNIELFDGVGPLGQRQVARTVANFFNYILDGRYDNSVFHRLVTGFVLQGGGFTFETDPSRLDPITTDPAVANEFGISNTLGTVAMAKQGGDPNSATSQFFFNLADNSGNLDQQNGGFTVFGKLAGEIDQLVVNALAGLPIFAGPSPFETIPLSDYTGSNFPTDTVLSNYALISSVDVIRRNEALTYSVVSNSAPDLVSASVRNNRLTLDYAEGRTGSATITVRATDRLGASVETTFTVSVANQVPTASVTLVPAEPQTTNTLTAQVTASDPDGDPVSLTYVWKVDGTVVRTTTTTSTTDNLDLSLPGNGDRGQVITVEVTPRDSVATGTTVTASATVIDSPPQVTVLTAAPGLTPPNGTVTATAIASDPDGDPFTLTFVWRVNGQVVRTVADTTDLIDQLDLTTLLTVNVGDSILVEVTPRGELPGAMVTASATVV